MSLDPQERAYIQGMQAQIDALRNDLEELRRWKADLELRMAYNAGQAAQGQRPSYGGPEEH